MKMVAFTDKERVGNVSGETGKPHAQARFDIVNREKRERAPNCVCSSNPFLGKSPVCIFGPYGIRNK